MYCQDRLNSLEMEHFSVFEIEIRIEASSSHENIWNMRSVRRLGVNCRIWMALSSVFSRKFLVSTFFFISAATYTQQHPMWADILSRAYIFYILSFMPKQILLFDPAIKDVLRASLHCGCSCLPWVFEHLLSFLYLAEQWGEIWPRDAISVWNSRGQPSLISEVECCVHLNQYIGRSLNALWLHGFAQMKITIVDNIRILLCALPLILNLMQLVYSNNLVSINAFTVCWYLDFFQWPPFLCIFYMSKRFSLAGYFQKCLFVSMQ